MRRSRASFRTFTQEDPIGLAGGLNLYGFAGGDPVNFSDPFGLTSDTVEVHGEDAKRRVEQERERDPDFRAMYDSLHAAPQHFSLVSSDAMTGEDAARWAGITGWALEVGGPFLRLAPELAPFVTSKTAGVAVYGVNSRNPVGSMKHELAHLYGIVETGRMYVHPAGRPLPPIFLRFPIP